MLWSSFLQKQRYQVLYQRSIHVVLIMSVLRKKAEFYEGEIAAGRLGKGAFSRQVFPLWESFPHIKVFLLSMKVLVLLPE